MQDLKIAKQFFRRKSLIYLELTTESLDSGANPSTM